MARPLGPMTAQMENFIRAEARGEDYDKILLEVFGVGPDSTKEEKHRAQLKMSRWRKRPDFKAIWDDEISGAVRRHLPGALNRLLKQIDNNNDWVANKAINDVMNIAKSIGIIQNEEQAVRVQFEGMPDIGSPDEDG